MSVKRVNKYNLSNFIPFRHSTHCLVINSPSVKKEYEEYHKQIVLISTEGSLIFLDKPSTIVPLATYLPIEFSNGHFAEFVCGDVTHDVLPDGSALLFTFWVELSKHCVPTGCYFATFRISAQREFTLINHKVLGAGARIASCYYAHITDKNTVKKICTCFISRDSKTSYQGNPKTESLLYEVKDNSVVVYNNVADEAISAETFSKVSGVVIRYDTKQLAASQWRVFGFDTGFAIITVSSYEFGMKFKKQVVKFTAPVSVALILPDSKSQDVNVRHILLSSTFGPVMVWKFTYENDNLVGEHLANLELNGKYDSITCGCIMGDLVLIGTFKGKMLAYKLRNITTQHITLPSETEALVKIDSFKQFNAPLTSLKTLDDCEACALTTEGAQILTKYIDLEN